MAQTMSVFSAQKYFQFAVRYFLHLDVLRPTVPRASDSCRRLGTRTERCRSHRVRRNMDDVFRAREVDAQPLVDYPLWTVGTNLQFNTRLRGGGAWKKIYSAGPRYVV
jgi:hypothetical protein